MPKAIYDDVLRFLHHACGLKGGGDKPDRELVERYLGHEEAAFSLLMQRHGPMILGICRRLAADPHAAEDGFQATFMVLVRQAASIRKKESLAPWLHRVARRLVLKARAKAAANQRREERMLPMASPDPLQELTVRELRSCLDEEIARLPVKYQTPILLCYFEGKSYSQAAQEIGCPKTTFTNRLNRALELLRRQLNRRGVTLAGAALASALTEAAAAPPLPAILAVNTMKAATLLGGSKAVACGCLTANALALAEEALTGMLVVKGKIVAMVLAVGLVAGGVGWAGYEGLAKTGQPANLLMAQAPGAAKQGDDSPKKDQPTLTDQDVDPLPEGAIARLGPRRFRHRELSGLAFSPDGKTLVGETKDGVIFWEAVSGKELRKVPLPLATQNSWNGLSPDGKTLAFQKFSPEGIPEIHFFDVHGAQKSRTPALSNLPSHFHFRFSPDGKSLAVIPYLKDDDSPGDDAFLIDVESGKVRMTLKGQKSKQYYNVVVSADNKTVVAGATSNNSKLVDSIHTVELLDFASGKLICTLQDPPTIDEKQQQFSFTFSPDSKMLAFGGRDQILLFDPATGKKIGRFEEMGNPRNLAFSPNGKMLFVVGWYGQKSFLYDVGDRKILHKFGESIFFSGLIAFTPDSKLLALGMGSTVFLWDTGKGQEVFKDYQAQIGNTDKLIYAPDGKSLASPGILWDTTAWKRAVTLPDLLFPQAISPNGKYLAFLPNSKYLNPPSDSSVAIWDVSARKMTLDIPLHKIISVEFSRDNLKVYTLGKTKQSMGYQLNHWDLVTGKQERHWNISADQGIRGIGSSGTTVFGGWVWPRNNFVKFNDLANGRQRYIPLQVDKKKEPHSAPVFSPDGRVVAVLCGVGHVCLFETLSGKETFFLQQKEIVNPNYYPHPTAWSADGRLLATGDDSGSSEAWPADELYKPSFAQTIRIWDAATGKELARFGGFKADVTDLTFAPDGSQLAAGLVDGTILILDAKKADRKLVPAPMLGKEKLEGLWSELISENATQAHLAIGTLFLAPQQAVPFLQSRLRPAGLADQTKIQKWITDLDSQTFAIRQTAAKELEKVGDQVQVPIQKALNGNPSLETRRRLEQVLKSLPDIPGPETIRTIRAIMALERIGTADARGVLEALAGGAPGARETEEAKESLQRLTQRAGKMP